MYEEPLRRLTIFILNFNSSIDTSDYPELLEMNSDSSSNILLNMLSNRLLKLDDLQASVFSSLKCYNLYFMC
jgi:hypothetical protein